MANFTLAKQLNTSAISNFFFLSEDAARDGFNNLTMNSDKFVMNPLFEFSADLKINGQAGNDTISTSAGNDVVYGGSGADTISTGKGMDQLFGGSGDDRLFAGADNDTLDGGSGNDVLYGEDGNDRMDGGTGNDALYGGYGNDDLYGGTGNDTLDGGSGNDVLGGGDGNDVLYGGSGSDVLYGSSGDDVINGGSGNDFINGGSGNDMLTGGQGNDTFDVRLGDGVDTITDFTLGQDHLSLNVSIFGQLHSSGVFSLDTGSLVNLRSDIGLYTGGHNDGSAELIYDQTTQILYFDQDGLSGEMEAVELVHLTGVSHLTVADFTLDLAV